MRHSLRTRITLATLATLLIGIWSLTFYVSQVLRNDLQSLLGEPAVLDRLVCGRGSQS